MPKIKTVQTQRNHTGKNNPNWKGGNRVFTCTQCGIVFERPISQTKGRKRMFCSQNCNHKYQKGHPLGIRTSVKCVCLRCGKEFYRKKSQYERGGGKYCSIYCSKTLNIGENGVKWIGGEKASKERFWKKQHVSQIRFKPISTEELNKILSGDDEK